MVIGFDAGINYKKATDLTAVVKESCPKGVDVFFDNTGGPIHDAVIKNLNIGARVISVVVSLLPLSSANLILASGSWGSSSSHAPASMGFWYSIGGTGEMKRSDISPTGTVQDKFVSKRMYSTGSNECQKRFCDCCMARISVSRS
jgi:NADPH:quinone reductase-like Zn-dependent oxidoreductase